MSLLKSGSLNAIAVIVRIGTGLILNKILAIFVGPSGYAVIGQFQNFVNIGTTFSTGGISAGVTKYTAEHADDKKTQIIFWRTAVMFGTMCAAIIGCAVILFRAPLATYFLKDSQYSDVVAWFGVLVMFLVWNGLLLAILNGLKQLRIYIAVNIGGALIGLVLTVVLVYIWGIKGCLIAIVFSQAVVFLVTVAACHRLAWFSLSNFFGAYDKTAGRKLASFAVMALVSAVAVPGSQILIRDHLGAQFGWQVAGYWQAMTRISDLYLLVITTTLSYYYLPRLAEIKTAAELRREVWSAYKVLLPLAMLLALPIYVMRGFITKLLFSEAFSPMQALFFWQLIGDVLKIGSWLLAFLMLAKAMTKQYVITEVIFSISLFLLTVFFTRMMGIEGAVFAFAVNYFIYWIAVYYVCKGVLE